MQQETRRPSTVTRRTAVPCPHRLEIASERGAVGCQARGGVLRSWVAVEGINSIVQSPGRRFEEPGCFGRPVEPGEGRQSGVVGAAALLALCCRHADSSYVAPVISTNSRRRPSLALLLTELCVAGGARGR